MERKIVSNVMNNSQNLKNMTIMFMKKFKLEKQVKAMHNEGKPTVYKCDDCDKVCMNSLGLITHYKSMHFKKSTTWYIVTSIFVIIVPKCL